MILAVALAVAVALAPAPIPSPAPRLKQPKPTPRKGYSNIAWQTNLASDYRSGPINCLLTDYDLGRMLVLPVEARGSKKVGES